jgi:hypothetical protein
MKSVVGFLGSAIPNLKPEVCSKPLNAMPVFSSVYGVPVWVEKKVLWLGLRKRGETVKALKND